MKTKAYIQATKILRVCDTATLVGSQAFFNEAHNVNRDIDIAISFEDLNQKCIIEGKCSELAEIRSEAPEVRGNTKIYSKDGIITTCTYQVNNTTRWLGVEKINYDDGSSIDILYYKEEDINAIRQTMQMLLSRNDIWGGGRAKEKRVRLFEILVATNIRLNEGNE